MKNERKNRNPTWVQNFNLKAQQKILREEATQRQKHQQINRLFLNSNQPFLACLLLSAIPIYISIWNDIGMWFQLTFNLFYFNGVGFFFYFKVCLQFSPAITIHIWICVLYFSTNIYCTKMGRLALCVTKNIDLFLFCSFKFRNSGSSWM